jgi:hypothetical protein
MNDFELSKDIQDIKASVARIEAKLCHYRFEPPSGSGYTIEFTEGAQAQWYSDGLYLYFRGAEGSLDRVFWGDRPMELYYGYWRACYMQNGEMFLVVIGGDSKLLWRVGPPSREFQNGNWGYFRWPDVNSGEERMESVGIVDVALFSELVRIVVFGGDGRRLRTSQALPNSTTYTSWT